MRTKRRFCRGVPSEVGAERRRALEGAGCRMLATVGAALPPTPVFDHPSPVFLSKRPSSCAKTQEMTAIALTSRGWVHIVRPCVT